jgi:hypothetical protein
MHPVLGGIVVDIGSQLLSNALNGGQQQQQQQQSWMPQFSRAPRGPVLPYEQPAPQSLDDPITAAYMEAERKKKERREVMQSAPQGTWSYYG